MISNQMRVAIISAAVLASSGLLSAQEANPTETQQPPQQTPIQLNGGEPLYKIQVVARDAGRRRMARGSSAQGSGNTAGESWACSPGGSCPDVAKAQNTTPAR